jgi:hypothetical protein
MSKCSACALWQNLQNLLRAPQGVRRCWESSTSWLRPLDDARPVREGFGHTVMST